MPTMIMPRRPERRRETTRTAYFPPPTSTWARTGVKVTWSSARYEYTRQKTLIINGAVHSLRICSEEMSDAVVEKALIKAAKRGAGVQVCGENAGEYDRPA